MTQPDTTAWMTHAECTPNPAWTTDHRPNMPLMRVLSKICDRCPVMADCAAYALNNPVEAHSGVYAGVWLPPRRNREWFGARAILHRKTNRLRSTA